MKRSKLHSAHATLGAKFVDFNGWELPLSYATKTLAEHSACRNNVAVFDVSHLGRLYLKNPEEKNPAEHLQWRLTNDLTKLKPMQAQYTHILNEAGFILDDLICVRLSQDEHLLIINAANYDTVCKEVDINPTRQSLAKKDLEESVFLAIQGPQTEECLKKVLGQDIIAKNQAAWVSYKDEEILMLGTGYTGEVGVECIVPQNIAEDFLLETVAADATPAGLGARDILRLEAGYPLHGHELGTNITPLQAQLDWVIAWEKGDFCGRDALVKEKEAGVAKLLWGLKIENERRPLRQGNEIYYEGKKVGEVTSGNFSPSLKCAIGMGFLQAGIEPDTEVEIDSRKAKVCKASFL